VLGPAGLSPTKNPMVVGAPYLALRASAMDGEEEGFFAAPPQRPETPGQFPAEGCDLATVGGFGAAVEVRYRALSSYC